MSSLNKAQIIGNLGGSPELKHTQSGQAVTSISVATNEGYTGPNGERLERVEWHRVTLWGKTAEAVCKHLEKGSKVYVEGRLQTREYTDRDGAKRYTTEIVAQNVIFLPSGSGSSGGADRPPPPSGSDAPRGRGGDAPPSPVSSGGFDDGEIPF